MQKLLRASSAGVPAGSGTEMSVVYHVPDDTSRDFTHLYFGVGAVLIVTSRQIKIIFFLDLKVEGNLLWSEGWSMPA